MISIVIPLYNKEKSILKTLESVIKQSYIDFEIVVVDDGSTDNSASVVESFNDSRIRLIRKENGGVCSARNRGIIEAKGEYVALLDADDLWDKEYLAEQVRMMNDFPEASMWGINFAEMSDGKLVRKLATGLPDGFRGYVENYFEIKGRISDLFCSSSVVIRKDVFEKVGMFDERIKYAEDNDMWWRIIARNKVAFFDKYMCFYQFDADNRALKNEIPLDKYLPYYISKYKEFADCTDMYRYSMCWAANIIRRYMEQPEYRTVAIKAGRQLDYSVIPTKYRYIFGLPSPLGFVLNKSIEKIKRLKNEQ